MTKKKSSGSIEVMKFEITPLPTYKEVQGKDWVSWGAKNDYPDYLVDLYLRSPRHNAIVNGKVNYIYGKGLAYDDRGLSAAQKAVAIQFNKFFSDKGRLRELILYYELFNGFALEVIWSKNKKKISEINHIPFNRLRTNKDEDTYFYSDNWAKLEQGADTGFRPIPKFDSRNPGGSQIYVFKHLGPIKTGQPNVYPLPEYLGSTIAIETDIRVGNFDNSLLKSGFTASSIVNFNSGEPETDAAKKAIVESVKSKLTGSDNAGEVIVAFNSSKENASTVTMLTPGDLDKQNVEIDKRTEQRIFTSHKITNPALFGIRQQGAISGDNNLVKDYELFQSTYVDIRQGCIEDVVNEFAAIYGVSAPIRFERTTPVTEALDSAVISAAYTQNEVRKMLGLPVVEKTKSDQSKEIVNALNSLSPLVANKVLEKLSDDEIRGLIGLGTARPQAGLMNSQDIIETVFTRYGRSRDQFNVIESKEFQFTTHDDMIGSEYLFADEISKLEASVLDLLTKDDKAGADQLSKALKISKDKVQKMLASLLEREMIDNTGDSLSVTDRGLKALDSTEPKTSNYEVVYGYDWRTGFNNSDKKTSRDWCKKMIEKNLFYTRAEIDMMKNDMGTDVWETKGGWYTKPGTDAHLPYCRHTWHQYLVKIK